MKLAMLAFLCMLVEGAVADWSAVYLRSTLNQEASVAAIGYSAFAFSMAACRIVGDVSVRRFGSSKVVALGGLIAVAGLALVLSLPTVLTACVGFAMVGVGPREHRPGDFQRGGPLDRHAGNRCVDGGHGGLCGVPGRAAADRPGRRPARLARRVVRARDGGVDRRTAGRQSGAQREARVVRAQRAMPVSLDLFIQYHHRLRAGTTSRSGCKRSGQLSAAEQRTRLRAVVETGGRPLVLRRHP